VILFSQSMDQSEIYIMDPRPKSKTGQVERHGSPRFMQSQGNKSGELPEVVIIRKHIPEQRIGQ